MKVLRSLFVLALFLIGVAPSVTYLVSNGALSIRVLRYLNLSPFPIAFVHPTFFSEKKLIAVFANGPKELEFGEKDMFFKNRDNYRTFMFEGSIEDRHRIVEYLYCRHPALIGFPELEDKLAIAFELVRTVDGEEKKLRHECRRD